MRQVRGLNRLTAFEVKAAKKTGWYGDGGGLYLEVDDHGRRWVLRMTIGGRWRDLGLGPLHKVTLPLARERAAEYRPMSYQGIDPVSTKRARRQVPSVPTFEQAADEVHRTRAQDGATASMSTSGSTHCVIMLSL
jgi:hypothetical protein